MKKILPKPVSRPRFSAFSLYALGLLLPVLTARAGLIFNFTATSETPQSVINDFQQAGARWSNVFSDPVTVNINIDFAALGSGILGQTSTTRYYTSYSNIKAALTADETSAADATAVAHLQSGSTITKLVNETSQHHTATLDTDGSLNNQDVLATSADLKAMGFTGITAPSDASITFSSNYAWDFDPSNGIDAGKYDLVGVATHEIGHALGFMSDVDYVDAINPAGPFPNENSSAAYFSTPLDLFRYSNFNGAIVNDFTAGTPSRVRYFSIDGGVTNLGAFSLGANQGDGYQASHWKDNLGLGIMDPTAAPGELLGISSLDVTALDVIGWNVRTSSVPDSGAGIAGLTTLLVLCGVGYRRRPA